MRTFLIAIGVLIIFSIVMVSYSVYLIGLEEEFLDLAEKISVKASESNWDDSKKITKEMTDKWNANKGILSVFNDHEDLDRVELALGDLQDNISYKNEEYTQKAISDIKILLKRLKNNESLSIENILGLSHFVLSCHNML